MFTQPEIARNDHTVSSKGGALLKGLGLVLAGALLLACAATPTVYSTILTLWPSVDWPFSRVFDRVFLVGVLLMGWLLRHSLPIAELREPFRATSWAQGGKDIATGVLLSLTPALLAFVFLVGDESGRFRWHVREASYFLGKLVTVLPASLVISFVEESVFRVALLDTLRSRMHLIGAVLVASLFYGAVHFLSPDRSYQYPGWSITIGFEYLSVLVAKLFSPGVGKGILGLTIVGVILCIARLRTGSIYLCVGMHAGWVIAIKAAFFLQRINPGHDFPEGVGRRYFLVAEPAGWIAMGATLLLLVAVPASRWGARRQSI